MAIKKYFGDRVSGLSSDAKPTNLSDGAIFTETDTAKNFILVSGSWTEFYTGTASDYDIKDLTDSTNLMTSWTGKQDALVSGTNIKTINSTSLLGSGNIVISGGGSSNLTILDKTDNYSIQTSDLGKIITMTATVSKTFTLPSVGSSDIGLYFTIVKKGSGDLVIKASDSDTILDSSAGGTLSNTVSTDIYSAITLVLISETEWITKEATSGYWVTA